MGERNVDVLTVSWGQYGPIPDQLGANPAASLGQMRRHQSRAWRDSSVGGCCIALDDVYVCSAFEATHTIMAGPWLCMKNLIFQTFETSKQHCTTRLGRLMWGLIPLSSINLKS